MSQLDESQYAGVVSALARMPADQTIRTIPPTMHISPRLQQAECAFSILLQFCLSHFKATRPCSVMFTSY